MGPLGFPEMFAIFIVALLLFGPKKLPELGRTLGKAITEFRRAKNELKTTFESHLQEIERETRLLESSSTSSSNYSAPYSHPYEEYNRYDPESNEYSAPSKVGGTEETHSALPAPESSVPSEERSGAEHSQALPPVAGTVARVNGTRPIEESVEPAREEHPV
jgi:sec-independent protein translocase protein TatA